MGVGKTVGKLTGMRAFAAVWLGQLVSVLATQMTQFARTIWVYEKTGSVTALGLTAVCYLIPFLALTPLAGAMVDRHNRKWMMALSDLGAGLATVLIFGLEAAGRLEVWHLYLSAAITGAFQAFQWPAYSAAISTMVPKEQLARANGMMSLVESGPGILAPLLAGSLLGLIHFSGILLIDIVTFVLAVGALALVVVPQPQALKADGEAPQSIWQAAAYGFRYVAARPSLLGLQLTFLAGNLFMNIGFVAVAPLILARTGNNAGVFGLVESAGAVGGVLGGIIMSLWGGFKRRVHGVLLGWIALGLLGELIFGFGRDIYLWLPAMFIWFLFPPLIDASNQAIWQAKVAPGVQGRVFSARQLIGWVAAPLAPLIAGPLADYVLEPGMQSGALADTFGWLVGTGTGSGLALLIMSAGLLTALVGVAGYLSSAVRNAEEVDR